MVDIFDCLLDDRIEISDMLESIDIMDCLGVFVGGFTADKLKPVAYRACLIRAFEFIYSAVLLLPGYQISILSDKVMSLDDVVDYMGVSYHFVYFKVKQLGDLS